MGDVLTLFDIKHTITSVSGEKKIIPHLGYSTFYKTLVLILAHFTSKRSITETHKIVLVNRQVYVRAMSLLLYLGL